MPEQLAGACHCGTVRFKVRPVDGLKTVFRCNCSLCVMRGAVMCGAVISDLVITEGAEALTLYQFHTGAAKHYFCSNCGVYTHHQRRFDPSQFAVNVACLEGVSPLDFVEVPVLDGANHPKDTGRRALRTVGIMSFIRPS
jgi:hypothetical protein